MRQIKQPVHTIFAPLLLSLWLLVWMPHVRTGALTTSSPSLVVSRFKITSGDGQFVLLYNTTDAALNLDTYQLGYFNHYDLAKATSSRLLNLNGILPAHSYYLVNDSALTLCSQLMIDTQTLGFSTTAGLVEVLALNQSNPGQPGVPTVQDYVSWSKGVVPGITTLPGNTAASLRRLPLDDGHNPAVVAPGSGNWQQVQPSAANPCNLVTADGAPVQLPDALTYLLTGAEPPATFSEEVAADQAGGATKAPVMPPADIGLTAPRITELLPNPAGTGNDASDEFIELYNSNAAPFDLSGFMLETGLSSTKTYTFPTGTILPPQSFKAVYAEATSVSLSNTSSQASLLDPFGNVIAKADSYSSAKDGQAWALANGAWHWTLQPTPGAANVIKTPASKKAKSTTAKSKSKSSAAATKALSDKKLAAAMASGTDTPDGDMPIHLRTLALVIGLALLYGVYEYRKDIALRLRQLRRYAAAWLPNRRKTAGRRSD